jgi:glycosyltransferase involved in cell wall biosynthesis
MLPTLESSEKVTGSTRTLRWHIITCEYPPQSGGVSDYTYLVAKGLAALDDDVHIWCPAYPGKRRDLARVQVHADLGTFSRRDLKNADAALNRFPGPRHLLVQWVPHGFGMRSVNLPFCLWLSKRSAKHGDVVDVMVHEPFLPFRKGRWRQNAAAAMHRLMMMVLLGAARQVWISTPAWEKLIKPFERGKQHRYQWLPLPSTVPLVEDDKAVTAIRDQFAGGGLLAGHFGTFGPPIAPMLHAIAPGLLRGARNTSLLLIGPGSTTFREKLIQDCPDLEKQVHAAGHMDARDPRLSLHLSACDLLIQPYPDGVTSRRTTVMAALCHGRPTITTAGALTEPFWQSSGAIRLAPAGDPDAFVDLTLELLSSATDRAALGNAGRELYQREFDINRIVELLRGSER